MKKRERQILDRLKEIYQHIGSALRFKNPFELLIATILSAQTTDKQVNKVTLELFRKYPDPYTMGMLSVQQLEEEIRTIGLYKNKSKNIIATCHMLTQQYHGIVPNQLEELILLPGVGRKTAGVVLSNAYHIPAIAVDTHVFRVANRLKLTTSNNVATSEQQLMKLIPKKDWSDAHHWLIWHGRLYCKARNPECQKCGLNDLCNSEDKRQ